MKPTTTLFTYFLSSLSVPHTKRYSDHKYREHPHRSNLYGISSLLDDYDVKSLAVRIDDKQAVLSQLPLPFIAEVGGDLAVVERIESKGDGKQVVYTSSEKQYTQPEESFLKNWTGVALVAEKNEKSAEPDLAHHKTADYITKTAIAATILSAMGFLAYLTWTTGFWTRIVQTVPFVLISGLGLYLTILLLKTQYNHSRQADKICTMFGKHDCKEVINYTGSKLLGQFGWGEIGFGFFAANLIVTVLALPGTLFVIGAINIGALVYSLWSVWYQKYVVRRWCTLCLLVQGVVLLLAVNSLLGGCLLAPIPDVWTIAGILCFYACSCIGAALLVPVFAAGTESERLRCDLMSLKSKESVFSALLAKENSYAHVEDDSRIIFGNPDGAVAVTVLSNPHCGPCAQMHQKLKMVMAQNSNVRVRYVFTSFSGQSDHSAEFLIAIYTQYAKEKAEEIYDKWFAGGSKQPEEFFSKYPVNIATKEVLDELEKHSQWRKDTGFRATPTMLVNGYELPRCYSTDDLARISEVNV